MVQCIKEALVNAHACIWLLKVSRIPSDWEEQGEREKKRTAEERHVVYSSPLHGACWWVVQEGGGDSATQTLCIGLYVWEKVENHCSVWPLSWAKAKQIHLSQQFPTTSFSQAPWWHQPCFRNYLTFVFQISDEPARVTNTHISSGKLSTHQTGCRTSFFPESICFVFGERLYETKCYVSVRSYRQISAPHGNVSPFVRKMQT